MTQILVCEDDDQIRLPLVDLLEANGYEVLSAINGRDGIEWRAGKIQISLFLIS
ncbi:MAG: hypothetical protein LR015_10000 [Verrucomicrobia bacterium]|nr:hypothetical protein [Verrucomicrobiota bacterium]